MIVTRFAPSPTGLLHLGHAYSALFAWRAAREAGGRFLLRIEDIDLGRCREEFVSAILRDLAWLGLDWGGEVRRQSRHFDDYRAALARLEADGLLYPCFCTRAEIAAATSAPPRGGRRLSRHVPAAFRRGAARAPGARRRLGLAARHGRSPRPHRSPRLA
jgi:glutamyl-Q tRNA(Asp) synthetase